MPIVIIGFWVGMVRFEEGEGKKKQGKPGVMEATLSSLIKQDSPPDRI